MNALAIVMGVARASFELLAQMAPYLLFGFLIAGVLHVFFPLSWIARHLGKSNVASVVKAVILGIPLPLCSCGVIPAAILLRKKGASTGAVISFLIATPITGVDSILATYALMGPFFMFFRVLASACTALVAGLLANLVLSRTPVTHEKIDLPKSCCHACSPVSEDAAVVKATKGIGARIVEGLRYSFFELLGDIWRWLLMGLVIAGAISYLVPDTLIEAALGHGLLPMVIMLFVGIPMYVCATGSLPIAAALMMKGMSPGAALVFLLAGPATNTVTITVVAKELGKSSATLYVLVIALGALAAGAILDVVWPNAAVLMRAHEHGTVFVPRAVELGSALVLAVLMIVAAIREIFEKRRAR